MEIRDTECNNSMECLNTLCEYMPIFYLLSNLLVLLVHCLHAGNAQDESGRNVKMRSIGGIL